MKTVLVVVRDFGDYKRGARIEDPVIVEKLLASHSTSQFVVTKVAEDNRFSAKTH